MEEAVILGINPNVASKEATRALRLVLFLSFVSGYSLACMNITSPGSYSLSADAVGAPYQFSTSQACVIISSGDVDFSCGQYKMTNNGTANAIGIVVNGTASGVLSNITIRDCNNISNYSGIVRVQYADSVLVRNITGNATSVGVSLYPSANNSALRDSLVNGSTYAIQVRESSGVLVENCNSSASSIGTVFYNYFADNITLRGNRGHGANTGMRMTRIENSTIELNTIYSNSNYDYYVDGGSKNINITGNRGNLSSTCVRFNTATNINMTDNTMNNCSSRAVYLDGSVTDSHFSGNTIYSSGSGFYVYGLTNTRNTLAGNHIYNNPGYGIQVYNSPFINITGNDISNTTNVGIFLYTNVTNNWVVGNTVSNSRIDGIQVRADCNNNHIVNSTLHGNTNHGIRIWDSNNTYIENAHLYSNGWGDFNISSATSSRNLYITNITFDSPAGDMAEHTSLDINDVVEANQRYLINWSRNSSAIPENYTEFAQKSVNITSATGTTIDTLVFRWNAGELSGYDESRFELWKWNGTWTELDGVLDTLADTITVTSLVPGSDYTLLQNGNATPVQSAEIDLSGANVTGAAAMPRWGGNESGNATTEGGNISAANLSGDMLTDRWAGFFGNVTGSVVLQDAGDMLMHSWAWSSFNGGSVCASTNSTLSTLSVQGAEGNDIDTAWGFNPAVADSGTNTFVNNTCTIGIGPTTFITNASYADTGYAGGFITCALKANGTVTPGKADMLFCSNITGGGLLYNGQQGDYEIMVPTPYAGGAAGQETYYFYANLN